MEAKFNESLMEHFRAKRSVCPGTFLQPDVNVLFYSKTPQKKRFHGLVCFFFKSETDRLNIIGQSG